MAPSAGLRFQLLSILIYACVISVGINMVSSKACPLYCLDVVSMTCNGTEVNFTRCNCCLAPKGCTLHLADGRSVYCS
ncbi:hypothetical protein CDL12_26699 [Handroanthus impetiginosus]|uniref:Uncharacterized protein n=1 Tax=Handroanthus impetiginosus TaxID=429701 RepID=A0A2G9G672_9LAMI|nr:hypothetical protein CDL12_26699 [Handroanthus impetiginosus]